MDSNTETTSFLSRRYSLTTVVAVGMSALFYCYSLAMQPLLKSPLEASTTHPKEWVPPVNRPRENTEMAKQHLPTEAWAATAKYQLRSKATYVYTDQWEQVDDDQAVRFQPFAMIIKSKDNKSPLTVYADSAYIKFESKFSPTSPKPGKIISGTFEGKVHIAGADGLKLTGRNFTFSDSAEKIYSDHNVTFAFDEHYGKALGIELELIPDDQPDENSLINVIGIRSVRLRRNVDMHLQTVSKKKEPDPEKRKLKMVQIRSTGSFDFTSADNTATFLQDVQVFSLTAPDEYDSLRSDRLTIFFKEKKKEIALHEENLKSDLSEKGMANKENPKIEIAEQKAKKKKSFQGINRHLEFQRLVAEGRNVLLISQKNSLKAKMTELLYDGTTHVVQLIHPQNVEVLHRTTQMRSPEITLLNDDKNKVKSVLCSGAGWMEHYDEKTGEIQFSAHWKKHLRKFPDQKSNLDIIELSEDVLVREPPRKMALAANYIRLWVNRQTGSLNRNADDARSELRPQRLLALKNVAMVSPEMQTETDRLEIWFEEKAHLNSSKNKTDLTSHHHAKAGDSLRLAGNDRNQSGVTNTKQKRQIEPIQINSKLIRVRVLRSSDGKQTEVAEVWTEGDVIVTQKHQEQHQPLKMTGEKMHVVNHSAKSQVLTVYGTPAHIYDRGMHMEGETVHLDRQNNRAWIDGAGLLELPIDKSMDGKKLDKPELLDIVWKEKMVFDGQEANFFGDVKTELNDNRTKCQHMQVQLTHRISFSERNSNEKQQKNGIKSAVCQEGVEVESYEYLKNKLQSIRKAGFYKLTVDQKTGQSIAEGPGWVTIWRRSNGRQMQLPGVRTVQANQPSETDSNKKWEYMRVDFSGKTSGNLKDRFTTFRDRVRTVFGPVEKPGMTINPDDLPENSGWMRCKSLQLTQHKKTKTEPAYIEMAARGNAELDGNQFHPRSGHNQFHARAETISYDQSKGLYVLRSVGKRKATIWRRSSPTGEYSQADAQRMEFIPLRNKLKLDRTTGLQGVQ